MCSIINHSNAAMIMFQPKDSQNNDIIQVHLCRGNIAIINDTMVTDRVTMS